MDSAPFGWGIVRQPQANPIIPDNSGVNAADAWNALKPLVVQHLQQAYGAARDPNTWLDAAHKWSDAMLAGTSAPGMRLFHGSGARGLTELRPSEYGPMGPAVYLSPAENIAKLYQGEGGALYNVPYPEGIFHGSGRTWAPMSADFNPFQLWRDQIGKLADAAGPSQQAVLDIGGKLSQGDGYQLYGRLRQLLGSDEATQALFKRAGFSGVSGMVDGPEVAYWGNLPIQQAPGIRAFHGSPYAFDRFDLSKIGTGEGAQAYGHGLYFAGNEAVARGYRDALSDSTLLVNGKPYDAKNPDHFAALTLKEYSSPDEAIRNLIQRASDMKKIRSDWSADSAAQYRAVAERIAKGGLPEITEVPQGHMYEVNINARPEQLLDWDKPLSEQSDAVRKALTPQGLGLTAVGPFPGKGYYGWADQAGNRVGPLQTERPTDYIFDPRQTGMEIARGAGSWKPEQASQSLLRAGIPGIQYLDAGSRSAGDGTRNYVIFDPSLIDIVRRYAIPGMVGGSAVPFGWDHSQ